MVLAMIITNIAILIVNIISIWLLLLKDIYKNKLPKMEKRTTQTGKTERGLQIVDLSWSQKITYLATRS